MTLCLAASCQHENQPCIILCCDHAGTRGQVKSEDSEKIEEVWGCFALLAGVRSDARELLACCAPSIRSYEASARDDLSSDRFLASLRDAVGVRRRQIISAHLGSRYGFSYDEFLASGRRQFPESHYLRLWEEIKALDLQAELILSSFTDDEALLISISMDGKVSWDEHYSVIGSGSRTANAIIRQREYADDMELEECLYRVIEAKTAAETDPYVGKATSFLVRTSESEYHLEDYYVDEIVEEVENVRTTIPKIELPKGMTGIRRVSAEESSGT